MPGIIDRSTGKIIYAPQYTQEQKDQAWDVAIRHFLVNHPEKINERKSSNEQQN